MANGTFGGGNGSIESPYLVEDAWDLNAMRNNIYAEYRLTKDIDMRLYNDTVLGQPGWIPIDVFRGVIDGNGYTIYNLYLNSSDNFWAFIKKTIRGKIKNLQFKNARLIANANGNQGIIIGQMTTLDCLIENCYLEGSMISVSSLSGGICAACTLGTIKNSYVNIKISAISQASLGGLVGSIDSATIINCYALGSITGTASGNSSMTIANSLTTATYKSNTITSVYGLSTGYATVPSNGSSTHRKTLAELKTASTFVGWSTPDYDYLNKLWKFTADDTPRLAFQNRVKYLFYHNGEYKTYNFTTNQWSSLGATLPSDDSFIINGISSEELELIPRIRIREFANQGTFDLVASTDKFKAVRNRTKLTLTQSAQLSDGVILKATLDLNTLGDAVSQITTA